MSIRLSIYSLQLILLVIHLKIDGSTSGTVSHEFCGHSSEKLSDIEESRQLIRVPRAASQQREQQANPFRVRFDITSERIAAQTKPKTIQGDCDPRGGPNDSNNCQTSASTTLEGKLDTKTIETAVFIDQALDNKFNGLSNGLVELNKLVQTIMNQVQYLFKYSSLKVPIRIKLVLVEHLRESERRGYSSPNSARGDIDAYLTNFCNWQQTRLESDRRLWWDHAILLSG